MGDIPVKFKRVSVVGVAISEKENQIYSDKELEDMNRQIVKEAEAKAEAQTVLFTIKKKQDRENIKQSTAKWLSWAAFALMIGAMVMGGITKGYKRWGIMAGSLFCCGMVLILIPEFTDYIKWALIPIGAVSIILGLSHTKHFTIARPGLQAGNDKDG